jgi:hypothetical protein
MTSLKKLAAASVVAGAAALSAQPAQATLFEIEDILSDTESNFQFSVFHDAESNAGMTGDVIATMDAVAGTSYFNSGTGAFRLEFTLQGGASGSMSGFLDFGNDIIGTLLVKFSGFSFDGQSEFNLTFLNADYGHDLSGGTDEGPGPNSFETTGDGTFLSLWGAEGTPLTTDPNASGFGGFDTDTTTIGLDMVVSLRENPNITETSEPATLALIGAGLVGAGIAARRRRAA